jgi:hypothetical protein
MAKLLVTYGAQKFSPVQYQTFDVGPFSIEVETGDNPLQAASKAREFLRNVARDSYKEQLAEFLANVKEAGDAARRK